MRFPRSDSDTLAKWTVRILIAAIVTLSFTVALYFAARGYRILREKRVRFVYDAQRSVVDDSVRSFAKILESEGFQVLDETYRQGGSGDWRTTVMIVAKNAKGDSVRCRVEVQGFVSHNAADQPIWTDNLPMTIKSRREELDARFIELLTQMIEKRRWKYVLK